SPSSQHCSVRGLAFADWDRWGELHTGPVSPTAPAGGGGRRPPPTGSAARLCHPALRKKRPLSHSIETASVAVPGEVQGGDPGFGRIAQAFVDVEPGNAREASPDALGGEDEVEVQFHEHAEEAAGGGLVDLGE